MDTSLVGRFAVVTGASRGLGREIARVLWSRGASIAIIARSDEALALLADELEAKRDGQQTVTVIAADLAREDAISSIVDRVTGAGDVDILVNNAAIPGPIGPLWENDVSKWETTIRVNLLAPVQLCRGFTPGMRARRRGKIVNLSGGGATSPRPNVSAYASAKAGLVRFTETLALELRAENVQVNCVAPGPMNTEILRAILRAGPERAGQDEHARAARDAQSGDAAVRRAADLCAFLASPASDGITGRLISAAWDPWERLPELQEKLARSDIYTLRRIVPGDRGERWE